MSVRLCVYRNSIGILNQGQIGTQKNSIRFRFRECYRHESILLYLALLVCSYTLGVIISNWFFYIINASKVALDAY